LYNQDFMY